MPRTLQFLFFFSTILTVFGLMQWYAYAVYRRWVRQTSPTKTHRWLRVGRSLVIVGNGMLALSFFSRGSGLYEFPSLRFLVIYPAGMWFSSVILAFVILATRDLLRFIVFWVNHGIRVLGRIARQESTTIPIDEVVVDEGKRRFLKAAGTATMTIIAATPIAASLATARDYQVRRIPLYFPNLPLELENFLIAQVSDFHTGVYMSEADLRNIIEITNGLRPQVTVITGDLVDTNDREIDPLHAALKCVRAERGVYAVLGNHDHFATGDRVAAAVQDAGVRMLRNEHATLIVDDGRIAIIGIDDCSPRRNFANLPAAINGLDPEAFRVMLVHQPRFWPEAKSASMDLTLVGHTHGGQVGMEMLGMRFYPVTLAYDHPMGHYIEDSKQLYVNVGVGMVGAPIRLVRPEIALFELHRGEPVKFVPSAI